MNTTEKFFINVLRCFATGTEAKLNTEDVDIEELFALSKKHSMIGIVAYTLHLYGDSHADGIERKFAKEYDRTIMQMLSREASAQKLCTELSRLGIPHIVFKGATVSSAYPVSALRAYGDVDIIVRKEHLGTIRELMTKDGFAYSLTDEGVVSAFKRGRERYEFHTALNVSNIKDAEYFTGLWENAVVQQGETHIFSHNFHLCYLICHLEKHVYGSGAGVRMYLDIALYIKKYADSIDLELVRDTLSACGLGRFLDTVLYLCKAWFDAEIPDWVEPMEDSIYAQMCEFMLSGGVFGEQNHKEIMQDDLRREMSTGKKGAKLRFLISRVFPSGHELYRMYPRFRGKLLWAWCCHVGDVIKNRKLSKVKVIMTADAESAEQKKAFLESIGSRR